jgi:diacylglycerol kinase family enzyme
MIVNPHASTVSSRLRGLVSYALQSRYELDAVDTEARGHATELCREAAHEGYDLVVAFGGDGTVNEAANGLVGSPTPLTCLPGGSANVFGKLLGIPGELIDATERLLAIADDWRPRRVDLGTVNGRCFTFASGLGLDASVVQRVDSRPHLKARFGPYFFASSAVSTFLRRYLRNPPRLLVEVDGVEHAGVTVIVQNGRHFTYFGERPIDIAAGPELDSGTLAGCVLRRASPLDLPAIGRRALFGGQSVSDHRQVSAFVGARELIVRTRDSRPLPLQVDGDYLGEVAQASYGIIPRALTVLA